jgi:uncharacterized repeat protein (TIGR02543 family)
MPMRQLAFASLLLLCCVSTASAASIDGFVILYPIEYSTFRSVGHADYFNDLNQLDSAAMSGEHVVEQVYAGNTTFMIPVHGDGVYHYAFEGPTNPGACYGTWLHAIARPTTPPISNTPQYEGTWYGYTQQCAPGTPNPIRYYLGIWINLDGTVTPGGGSGYHDAGETVSIYTAAPSGYQFQGWTGDITSSELTTTVYMNNDKAVTANWLSPPPQCSGCACTGTCQQSESCPLILDLNGDGIHTTGLEDPVHFWIDLQGRSEATAWTDPNTEEAFLWTDLNNDHMAQVTELFGSRMIAHNGNYHAQGFEALAKYDRPYYGGDNDGQITHEDWLWARLKLWVDRNHDGVSQPTEISVPSSHRIVALNVPHIEGDSYDEHGNELYLVGSYVARTHGNATEERLMADVEFKFIAN